MRPLDYINNLSVPNLGKTISDSIGNIKNVVGDVASKVNDYALGAADQAHNILDIGHDVIDLPWNIGSYVDRVKYNVGNSIDETQRYQDLNQISRGELTGGIPEPRGKENIPMQVPGTDNKNLLTQGGDQENLGYPATISQDKFNLISTVKSMWDKLPFVDTQTNKAIKNDIKKAYRFQPGIEAIIDKEKIRDVSPVIEPTLGLRRDTLPLGMLGNFSNNTTVNVASFYPFVTAHETLHNLFWKKETKAAEDPVGFNNTWNRIAYNTPPTNRNDQYIQDMMKSIDDNLRNNKAYENLGIGGSTENPFGIANERFAYLGESYGNKDFQAVLPYDLARYYYSIFKDAPSPSAPYMNRGEEQMSKEYNDYLKSIGRY